MRKISSIGLIFVLSLLASASPVLSSECIGTAPHSFFNCVNGIWTFEGSLMVGNGVLPPNYLYITVLLVFSPIHITGSLFIASNHSLFIEPPILNDSSPILTKPMIKVGNCLTPDSLFPSVSLGLSAAEYIANTSSTVRIAGIETACNTSSIAKGWNHHFPSKLQPTVFPRQVCQLINNSYETEQLTNNNSRFMMYVLFEHQPSNANCKSPPPIWAPPYAPKMPKKKENIIFWASIGSAAGLLVSIFLIYIFDLYHPIIRFLKACFTNCSCCSSYDDESSLLLIPSPPPPYWIPASNAAPTQPNNKLKPSQNALNNARQSIQLDDWTTINAGSSAASFVSYEASQF